MNDLWIFEIATLELMLIDAERVAAKNAVRDLGIERKSFTASMMIRHELKRRTT